MADTRCLFPVFVTKRRGAQTLLVGSYAWVRAEQERCRLYVEFGKPFAISLLSAVAARVDRTQCGEQNLACGGWQKQDVFLH